MVNRMVQDLADDPAELREADAMLQEIPYLEMIPGLTWENPSLPTTLLLNPSPPGSGLKEWKGRVEEALEEKVPIRTDQSAVDVIEDLMNLHDWITFVRI